MVCVDNSEFTRNGDYAPTRFQAQTDAVNLLAGAKTQHHPENTVGVMTMAGKSPQVLVTPTPDLGKVLNAMQAMKIEGQVHLSTAVQIAQLALKHRENKNQRQRIVIFVGSPISEDKVGGAWGVVWRGALVGLRAGGVRRRQRRRRSPALSHWPSGLAAAPSRRPSSASPPPLPGAGRSRW